jgi:hypothetical protein
MQESKGRAVVDGGRGVRCRGCPVTLADNELRGEEDDYDGLCVRCAELVFSDPWVRGAFERPVDVDGPGARPDGGVTRGCQASPVGCWHDF